MAGAGVAAAGAAVVAACAEGGEAAAVAAVVAVAAAAAGEAETEGFATAAVGFGGAFRPASHLLFAAAIVGASACLMLRSGEASGASIQLTWRLVLPSHVFSSTRIRTDLPERVARSWKSAPLQPVAS